MDTLYKDKRLHLTVEWFKNAPFIHCDIYEWSANNYKEYLKIWCRIIDKLRRDGYDEIFAYAETPQVGKFAELFGFVYTDFEVIRTDGERRRILKCHKPYQQ